MCSHVIYEIGPRKSIILSSFRGFGFQPMFPHHQPFQFTTPPFPKIPLPPCPSDPKIYLTKPRIGVPVGGGSKMKTSPSQFQPYHSTHKSLSPCPPPQATMTQKHPNPPDFRAFPAPQNPLKTLIITPILQCL